jgi:hypothetical protein
MVFVGRLTVFVGRSMVFVGRLTVFVGWSMVFVGRLTVFVGRPSAQWPGSVINFVFEA